MKKSYSVSSQLSKPTVFAISLGIAVVTVVAAILLFSLFMTVVDIPKDYAFPLSSVALGIGSFIGSRFAAKKLMEKGYLCGIILGLLLFVIFTIVAIIVGGAQFTALTPLRLIISVLMGMLGGISGINTKSTRSLVK